MVYIPKGEHDDPHELPQQQDLEGSTKIDHTLYSHADTITPTPNSAQKHEYIYQHFQGNEKVYESDPKLATEDNFACNQNCHTNTQKDQTLTPCTHAYNHIKQHVNNLDDPIQQHTVYTNEVDASLFTMDTTTPCDYNINTDMSN